MWLLLLLLLGVFFKKNITNRKNIYIVYNDSKYEKKNYKHFLIYLVHDLLVFMDMFGSNFNMNKITFVIIKIIFLLNNHVY